MSAPHVVVLTGAGISADSGLATFRGAGGLWEGHSVLDVATPEAWARDPARVWRFYQERRARLPTVQPNAAHAALARLARALEDARGSLTLVSQNVDDLHQRAGSRVLAMHGQLTSLACERCGRVVEDHEHTAPGVFVPCGACGHARLRPDVVWFGEIPRHLDEIDAALARAAHFVAIGTSGLVYPAAGLLGLARARGAVTWVFSLDESAHLHQGNRFLGGRAVDTVPSQVERWVRDWCGPTGGHMG